MSTRELKNLRSTLLTGPTEGRRASRLAARQAAKAANEAKYREARERRGANPRRLANNRRSERAYMRGETTQANYRVSNPLETKKIFERYEAALSDNGKFIVQADGNYYTLSMEKYTDLMMVLNSKIMFSDMWGGTSVWGGDADFQSDEQMADAIGSSGGFSIMNPSARAGGGYNFRMGAYFPYTHDFDDEGLTDELAKLGCWTKVDPKNYKENCLYHAMESAGVSDVVLQALKFQILRRTISCTSLKAIAEEHNLFIEVHPKEGNSHIKRYGNETGHHVPLALFRDHYIHLYKTKYTSWAIMNYDQIKDRERWWLFVSDEQRKEDRGMTSIRLMETVLETAHLTPITASTYGVFKTQFHDKVDTTEFDTLEYPKHHARAYHPERHAHDLVLEEQINMPKLNEIYNKIQSRLPSLLPDTRKSEQSTGELREKHNKIRDIYDYLTAFKEVCDKDGTNKVKYFFKHGVGRLYAKGETKDKRSKSMQGCFSCLRPALIGHVGHDVDIVNSLPVITVQWLDRLTAEGVIDCRYETLCDYVANRDDWFAQIMKHHECSRDAAKTMVLIVLFGGEPEKHLKEMSKNKYRPAPCINKLNKQLDIVRTTVIDAMEDTHADLFKILRSTKKDDGEFRRSAFAILTHTEEFKIMKQFMRFVSKQEITVFSLIHDGAIISESSDDLLRDAESYIKKKTGYSIELLEKPLFGLQDKPIKELECLANIEPTFTEMEQEEEEEEQDEEEEEEEDKLLKRIQKLRETLKAKDPETLTRLDSKIERLHLGLKEQAKLLSRSRPVEANIFFDFEATTQKTHTKSQSLIDACIAQINTEMRRPDEVLAKIEKQVKENNLDKESEALLYQAQCPHAAYQVCFSEFGEDEVHEYSGAQCAKQFLDDLVEKYGVEMSPEDAIEPEYIPTIRLLAHNVTYDLSFLFQYLSRSEYIERGTSVVCGKAKYVRFGHERSNGTRKNRPNADLVNWMTTIGEDLYYSDPEKGAGRREHPQTWSRAVSTVRKSEEYLTTFSDFKKLFGIGDVICDIVKNADFAEFTERPPFCYDKAVNIRFADTYKMIPESLSKFGKMFNLPQAKEVMPYDIYTDEFVRSGGMATRDQLLKAPHFTDFTDLFENLKKWECEQENGEFDMLKYSRIYCEADVKVMKNGWRVFRDGLLDVFDIDCFHYPTIASLGNEHLTDRGCYEGVEEIAGVVQRFIANCTVGGRVMCANNQPEHVKGQKVADFDGVSLYPSSMVRIPGFLKGKPKIWDPSVDLDSVDGYFLKIKVKSVGKKFRFPIARLRTEEGGNDWTNDLEGKVVFVDRWTLNDLVKFSQIDYDIIQGYYYDEGRNPKINDAMQDLFKMRLKYKDEKNPMQAVVKLIMNSSYGICGLKPIDTDVRYVSEANKDNFIMTHYNKIKAFTQMNNREWRFELYKEIDTHFNRQHVACEILSVSKNIMNEVMCLAEDIGALIYYTDTDSMHIEDEFVSGENDSILGRAFSEKYGRELIGKQLGQFHTDFEFGGSFSIVDKKLVPCKDKNEGDIVAKESIFLGKKAYIDRIVDTKGTEAFHIRLKGICPKAILHKATEKYEGDPMKLFKRLFDKKPVEFDLNAGGAVCFKVLKNHTVTSVNLKREVKF